MGVDFLKLIKKYIVSDSIAGLCFAGSTRWWQVEGFKLETVPKMELYLANPQVLPPRGLTGVSLYIS